MKEKFIESLQLFITFFKIGAFTFGGGYAMIPLIQREVVEDKKWITDDDILEIIAIAESTPGPIAINSATFVGYRVCGFWGSFFATLGVVLPSFTIIFIVSLFLEEFMQNKFVKYAFTGIKSTVAFLIIKTGIGMFKKVEKKPLPLITFALVFTAMVLIDIFAISFSSIYFIIIGGVTGIIAYTLIGIGKDKNIATVKKEGKK